MDESHEQNVKTKRKADTNKFIIHDFIYINVIYINVIYINFIYIKFKNRQNQSLVLEIRKEVLFEEKGLVTKVP